MLRKYIAPFLFAILVCPVLGVAQPKLVAAKFGVNNQLIVNTATGLFSIKYGTKAIVSDASAAYAVGNDKYGTNSYSKRAVQLENKSDKIGAGTLLTLTSTKPGIPTMIQRFYCYSDKSYIVTELEIQGEALKSNYMAPLIAPKANVVARVALQTLFVPFDNDTFIRYQSKDLNEKPNISSEVGVVYDPQSRNGMVLGSLTHDIWKTGVRSAGNISQVTDLQIWGGLNDVGVTRDSMAHGSLKGDRIKSPKMFIGYFEDWRTGLETYAKTNSTLEGRYIKPWAKATPVGWNSWGVIGSNLNYDKAVGVADFFDKQIPAFRNADGTAYIDLDSYWDNMIKGGFRGDFSKLKDFVNYCKERNLQPGVYWAPFTDWGFNSKNKERMAEGGDYKFADMWTKTDKGYHDLDGARALDPTHPGTKARIAFVLGKLKDCGFKMIKIDFLGHAAAESTKFYDPAVTTGMQAYKVGMETVDNTLDNSMLVYAAISPSMATAPYVHMRRIACDAFKSIKDTEYTLNSVTYGWWQTYMYDYIDADHLVFEKESVGANRARLISGLISGPVILGDDYSKEAAWQKQVKEWLQRSEIKKLIISGKTFTPVDGGESGKASQTFIRKDKDGTYLAVFNYKNQPASVRVNLARLGLLKNKKYQLTDLLAVKSLNGTDIIEIPFNTEGAYIYKITD
jgi:alpha-galactosidase